MHKRLQKTTLLLALLPVWAWAETPGAIGNTSTTITGDQTVTVEEFAQKGTSSYYAAGIWTEQKSGALQSYEVVIQNGSLTIRQNATSGGNTMGIASYAPTEDLSAVAPDLTVTGNVIVDFNRTSGGGAAYGIRNTGMSTLTLNGDFTATFSGPLKTLYGVSVQKKASNVILNGQVSIEGQVSRDDNFSIGILSTSYAGSYTSDQTATTHEKVNSQVQFVGQHDAQIHITAPTALGIQAFSNGAVLFNNASSTLEVTTTKLGVNGIDIDNATGLVHYQSGTHTIRTRVDAKTSERAIVNFGLFNRGTFMVDEGVSSLTIEALGVGGQKGGAPVVGDASLGFAGIYVGRSVVDTEVASTLLKARHVNVTVSDDGASLSNVRVAGIYVENGALTTGASTHLAVNVTTTTDGVVTGIEAGSGGQVTLNGNTTVTMNAPNAKAATALCIDATPGQRARWARAEQGATIRLLGAQNTLDGNVNVGAGGQLVLGDQSATTVTGNVEAASLTLNENANLLVSGDHSLNVASLSSHAGTITFDTLTDAQTIAFTMAPESGSQKQTLTVAVTGRVNDSYANATEAANALAQKIESHGAATQIAVAEGVVNGSLTGSTTANGTLDTSTVVEKTNTKLADFTDITSMSRVEWRNELNHLTLRLGDLRQGHLTSGAWARVYGQKSQWATVDMTSTAVQVGVDKAHNDWLYGAAFSYTNADGQLNRGDATAQLWSLAGYASTINDRGLFMDYTVRLGRLNNDIQSSDMNVSLNTMGFAASVEVGQQWQWSNHLYVEPQVELAYSAMQSMAAMGSNGVALHVDTYQSLLARLGARVGWSSVGDGVSLYAHASVYGELLGDYSGTATYDIQRTTLDANYDDCWVVYGVGGQFQMGGDRYVYGQVNRSTGGDIRMPWQFSVGVRMAF